ncbi:TetR/AcrR family transcriptional regulator [Paraburkholderia phymatum]|uniref:TetR/AcrR family transcriptional regulator n=1 Tax=Paraburkholderia phymatum TaxID=148447 RepID=A0ACC6U3A4_9BURK
MPWSEDHKQATRGRIVEAAARAIREHGPDGVSLAAIMKSVGLTHGGFYAHFESKEALIAEALSHATAETLAWLDRTATTAKNGQTPALADIADAYLSNIHCEHPGRGCVLAACGTELTRADELARIACSDNVRAYLRWLGQRSRAEQRSERTREATGALAAMIGGMVLARATENPAEARKILATVRGFVRSALKADKGAG